MRIICTALANFFTYARGIRGRTLTLYRGLRVVTGQGLSQGLLIELLIHGRDYRRGQLLLRSLFTIMVHPIIHLISLELIRKRLHKQRPRRYTSSEIKLILHRLCPKGKGSSWVRENARAENGDGISTQLWTKLRECEREQREKVVRVGL